MAFLHPGIFLATALCVAIPIIIHLLLRRRRKPLEWGAMRFLLEAYKKQRSRLRIQQLILLATRCLIVLLVGGAIAGPILESAGVLGGGAGRDVFLLIDNSVASTLRADENASERVLEQHKATAKDILDALGPGDRAGVIALGRPADPIVVPASSDLGAVRELIDELEPTDARADIPGALRALRERDDEEDDGAGERVAILVSEFRRGSADLNDALDAQDIALYATEPSATPAANTQIIDIDPLRPVVLTGTGGYARDEQVRVSLRRVGPAIDSAQADELTVSYVGLEGERLGRQARTEVRWQAGEAEKTVAVSLDASVATGTGGGSVSAGAIVASIGRDALDADNTFRRPLAVLESLRVGVVARPRFERGLRADEFGPPEWITLALRPSNSSPIDVVDIEPSTIDTPTLASVDVLVLPAPDVLPEGRWQSIRRFADEGGLVIVFPSARTDVQLWSDAFAEAFGIDWRFDREPTDREIAPARLDETTANAALLGPVASELGDLLAPVRVVRTLGVEGIESESGVALRLDDGSPWLVASAPGAADETESENRRPSRGLVVYVASAMDLAWTDLPARPLMVPLFQELVRQGFGESRGDLLATAGSPVLAPSRSAGVRSADGGLPVFSSTVSPSGFVTTPIRRSGLFEARDASSRTRGILAMNPDTDGAHTGLRQRDALAGWLSGAMDDPDASVGWLGLDSPGDALRQAAQGSTIGWPLLVAGLALALLEVVMARFFSHAFRDTSHARTTAGGDT